LRPETPDNGEPNPLPATTHIKEIHELRHHREFLRNTPSGSFAHFGSQGDRQGTFSINPYRLIWAGRQAGDHDLSLPNVGAGFLQPIAESADPDILMRQTIPVF